MRGLKYLIAGLALGLVYPVQAADKAGQYSVRGAGLLSCETYLQERAADSPAHKMIGGWIDGYLSATNAHRDDTYDITSFQSTELIGRILQRHCAEHPHHRLFSVLKSMVAQLHEQRVVDASPQQMIVVDDRRTQLYNDTILRMQMVLAERGLIKYAQISGRFDEQTSAALARFQEERNFQPTGFPDQATLWMLFADV
ncbi:MAG: peptidoglycan-binding domain-containing protein [Pseudomonadota bacterium]